MECMTAVEDGSCIDMASKMGSLGSVLVDIVWMSRRVRILYEGTFCTKDEAKIIPFHIAAFKREEV